MHQLQRPAAVWQNMWIVLIILLLVDWTGFGNLLNWLASTKLWAANAITWLFDWPIISPSPSHPQILPYHHIQLGLGDGFEYMSGASSIILIFFITITHFSEPSRRCWGRRRRSSWSRKLLLLLHSAPVCQNMELCQNIIGAAKGSFLICCWWWALLTYSPQARVTNCKGSMQRIAIAGGHNHI